MTKLGPFLRTISAGVVAGVVVACSSAATDMAGEAMRDVGEMVADAGAGLRDAGMEMIGEAGVGAGEMLIDAGAAMVDSAAALDGSGSSVADAQDTVCDCPDNDTPLGHMVLRDRDGVAQRVRANPFCLPPTCEPGEWSVSESPCARLGYVGERHSNANINLQTGGACENMEPPPQWVTDFLGSPPFTLALEY